MNFYLLIFGSAASYVLGDSLAKLWSLKGHWQYLAATLGCYLLGGLLVILTIKKTSLSLAVATIPLVSVVAGVLLGYYYFEERLAPIQYLGLALSVLALALLLLPSATFQK